MDENHVSDSIWLDNLKGFLYNRVEDSHRFKKIIDNTLWFAGKSVFWIAVGFLIGIQITRTQHLAVINPGIQSHAIYLSRMILPFSKGRQV
jgi:hypothetical protein